MKFPKTICNKILQLNLHWFSLKKIYYLRSCFSRVLAKEFFDYGNYWLSFAENISLPNFRYKIVKKLSNL